MTRAGGSSALAALAASAALAALAAPAVLATLVAVAAATGCYSGARATRDVNRAWQGQSRAAIEARWGTPARVEADGSDSILVWSISHRHFTLPSAAGAATIGPDRVDAWASFQPGTTWTSTTEVAARVDPRGVVTAVGGPSLRWGAPSDANLRWGFLFGFHAGMGRLDDTSSPLPSGGLYIGGMLTRTVGLVGTYTFVSGSDDDGGAIGMAWGIGARLWTTARTSVGLGPVMILAWDPGFEDAGLEPGLAASASYAILRRGSFVLDGRLDIVGGTATTFGTLGLGINVN